MLDANARTLTDRVVEQRADRQHVKPFDMSVDHSCHGTSAWLAYNLAHTADDHGEPT